MPTSDAAHIVAAALAGLQAICHHGFKLAKAGVMLMKLQSASVQLQAELDHEGKMRVWSMKQERRTPGYTTWWEDMPVARA